MPRIKIDPDKGIIIEAHEGEPRAYRYSAYRQGREEFQGIGKTPTGAVEDLKRREKMTPDGKWIDLADSIPWALAGFWIGFDVGLLFMHQGII
jgi:hypothetical protein